MSRQFPPLRAITLNPSYRDPICTPLRVMVQMQEGPNCGLYQIVYTQKPLGAGEQVSVDAITQYAMKEQSK